MTFDNLTQAFEYYYKKIMEDGSDGIYGTKQLFNVGFTILHPEIQEVTTPWRKFSSSYVEKEWEWYLDGYENGNNSAEFIEQYAKMWTKMYDPEDSNKIVSSNYGWQLQRNDQLEKIIDDLKSNSLSRQAWVTIYDGKEKDKYKFDTPCTIGLGFRITDGSLHCSAIMRSNDLVYGTCNDIPQWYNFMKIIADELSVPTGTLYHYAANLHIYPRHFGLNLK